MTRSHTPLAAPSQPGPSRLWMPLVCIWLLVLMTFSVPGREGVGGGGLDSIALAKLATRGLCLTLLLVLLDRTWKTASRPRVLKIVFPLCLFVGLALLSTAWSPLKSVSLGQAGSLLVLLLVSIGIGILCHSPRCVSTILKHVSCALLLVSTLLLLARVLMPGIGSLDRSGSGVFHSTSAGANASLGLLLLLAARLLWDWKWSRFLLLPGLLVHGTALLLATNRVSLVLTVVLSAVIVWLYANRILGLAAIVGFSLAATVYLALDPGVAETNRILEKVGSYARQGQTADDLLELSGRSEMWEAVWQAYRHSPWLGHGYFVCSPTGEIYVWYEWANWTAHNVLLQSLMSTGIIGTVLLTWGLLRIVRLWILGRSLRYVSGRVTPLLAVVAAWNFVWGITNSSFLGPVSPTSVASFAVLGVAVGCLAHSKLGIALSPAGSFLERSSYRKAPDHSFTS